MTTIQKSILIKNSISAWSKGLEYILKNKWTQKYISFAIFLNFLVFIVLVFTSGWLSILITKFIQTYITNTSDNFFLVVISTVIWLILVFFILQTYSSVASIVNAPIYSILTEKIIKKEFPEIDFSSSNFVVDIFRALVFELKKLILGIAITTSLMFMNVLPIIGFILYLIISALQLIMFTGLDALEPFHSLKNYSFRKRLKEIFNNKYRYWPFLFISGILGSIPFVNIFLIPVSVVGGSILMKDNTHYQ